MLQRLAIVAFLVVIAVFGTSEPVLADYPCGGFTAVCEVDCPSNIESFCRRLSSCPINEPGSVCLFNAPDCGGDVLVTCAWESPK